MVRIRADYVFGTTDTAINTTDTTLSSPALARLPAVTGTDVAAVTLHNPATGVFEIVHVTAHTATATTATITRAQEGTTAASWPSGSAWLLGITQVDVAEFTGGVNVCRVARAAAYPLTAATDMFIPWDTETFDPPGWHDNATNPSRVTPTTPGYYQVNLHWSCNATSGQLLARLYKNGTLFAQHPAVASSTAAACGVTDTVYLNGTTDYVEGVARAAVAAAFNSDPSNCYMTVELVAAAPL